MDLLLKFLLLPLFFSLSFSSNIPPYHYHPSFSLSSLVPTTPLVLPYHKGPLIIGPGSINVYIFWYGNFTANQKSIITDFFLSFDVDAGKPKTPPVRSWWSTTKQYRASKGETVASSVRVVKQLDDEKYSLGRVLSRRSLQTMVRRAIAKRLVPIDLNNGIYLVLTSENVGVERFCVGSCGFHETLAISKHSKVLFGWVGNAAEQCAGQCAWPFAETEYGPPGPSLIPPNGDAGLDGMIINIATLLAGTATNPFDDGYYQGDRLAPLEAATACAGIFGNGAYPGYPGQLLVDTASNASFNAFGVRTRRFLLPAMWSPALLACKTTIG